MSTVKELLPQFKRSTLLVLMLVSAIWLGVNLIPQSQKAIVSYKAVDNHWMEVEVDEFLVYGRPSWVYVKQEKRFVTPPWKGEVDEAELKRVYGIKSLHRDEFSAPLEDRVFSWKAVLINLWFYGWSMIALWCLLERKWKSTSSPPPPSTTSPAP